MNGRLILVSTVGEAGGSKAVAAALACAGSDLDRPGLLIDVGARPPRPTLIASAGARELEERLTAHLQGSRVASRGQTCHLAVPEGEEAFEGIRRALPLVRDTVTVAHLPPAGLQAVLLAEGIEPCAAVLRADLEEDRPLTALAVHGLVERGLRVKVIKRPLARVPARRALFGILPPTDPGGLPSALLDSLLESQISAAHACYSEIDDEKADPEGTAQQERRGDARARRGRGLRRHAQRQAGR